MEALMDTKATEMSLEYDVFKQGWEDYMVLLAWVRAQFPCFVDEWRREHGIGLPRSACVIALLQQFAPATQGTSAYDASAASYY
jgi:hypothetical protein